MCNVTFRMALAVAGLILMAAGCATAPSKPSSGSAHYKIGKPYQINGRWYQPAEDPTYDRRGVASWYGDAFHGLPTANGEIFDMRQMTAAHTTLPLPSMVEVTNLDNGRRTVVRVNDRGPFAKDRIIDMSRAAAQALGFEGQGLANVRVRYIGPAALPGEPSKPLYASSAPPANQPTPLPQGVPAIEPITVAVSAPAKVSGDADHLGQLIEGADPGRDPVLPPPLSEPLPALMSEEGAVSLYAVQVAVLDNIEALPALRERLASEGPLQIARAGDSAEPARYRINLGPFPSESAAAERLVAVREAGYDSAEIIAILP